MNQKTNKKLEQIYRDQYLKEGDSPRGFFWNNIETQELRFRKILEMIPPMDNLTVHDIGCGTGGFRLYSEKLNYNIRYSGCEVVPEMVTDFRKNNPNSEVFLGHFLDLPYDSKSYDFVTLSGLFNMPPTDHIDWQTFCEETLKKMWQIARGGIVFNCLTSYSTFVDKNLFYLDPKYIFDFCHKNFSRHIKIDHSYPLYEFAVAVYRDEFSKKYYPEDAFLKYYPKC